jgi:leucyl-tRNA synthetase
MAYYTITRQIKKHGIQPQQLTDEVFDYVFLGTGKISDVAEKAHIGIKALKEMRTEFTYFYPLDSRHSGRDLVPNHLTFMVFNHTAIFPEALWPRQMVTNGSVMMQGAKMSKSFGNIMPLIESIEKFGADPFRLSILATAELLQDADFSPTLAKSIRDRLERFYRFCEEVTKTKSTKGAWKSLTLPDRWILSRLQAHVRVATDAMGKLEVRKAIHSALYELDQDIQWYMRRIADHKENSARKDIVNQVLSEILDAQVRMLAPVTPHICEELWEKMSGEGFVSFASWPTADEAKVDVKAEENETLIESTLEDTLNIIKATSMTPKKIYYYTAEPWKWKAYLTAVNTPVSAKVVQSELVRELMKDRDMKKIAKQLAKFVGQLVDEVNRLSAERKQRHLRVGIMDEKQSLKEATLFFKREFNSEIIVCNEEDPKRYDPKNRAQLAKPYRPAIYVE